MSTPELTPTRWERDAAVEIVALDYGQSFAMGECDECRDTVNRRSTIIARHTRFPDATGTLMTAREWAGRAERAEAERDRLQEERDGLALAAVVEGWRMSEATAAKLDRFTARAKAMKALADAAWRWVVHERGCACDLCAALAKLRELEARREG